MRITSRPGRHTMPRRVRALRSIGHAKPGAANKRNRDLSTAFPLRLFRHAAIGPGPARREGPWLRPIAAPLLARSPERPDDQDAPREGDQARGHRGHDHPRLRDRRVENEARDRDQQRKANRGPPCEEHVEYPVKKTRPFVPGPVRWFLHGSVHAPRVCRNEIHHQSNRFSPGEGIFLTDLHPDPREAILEIIRPQSSKVPRRRPMRTTALWLALVLLGVGSARPQDKRADPEVESLPPIFRSDDHPDRGSRPRWWTREPAARSRAPRSGALPRTWTAAPRP